VTPFPALLAKVVNVTLAGSSRWTGRMRDDLVDALKRDSGQLQEIAEGFRNRMQGISIVSCLETMATPPFREPVKTFHHMLGSAPYLTMRTANTT
jgi:hypothetical protein